MTAWVVIPAYEAERTLAKVLARVPDIVRTRCELLVIDDGSSDATADAARSHGVRVLRNPENRGYALTQKRGFATALDAGASTVAILHADGQYPPESLPEILAPIERGTADVVLGTRVTDGGARRRGMPLYKWLANRALTWVENRCYGLELSEYHTGMMAYSRNALERLPWRFVSDTFHIDGELAMLAGRRGLRIEEVPVPHVYADEHSYLRPIPYGLTVLAIAIAVRTGAYDAWLERRARRRSDRLRRDA
jgi:glycosyltransferase involved in cell wall biosynthesis